MSSLVPTRPLVLIVDDEESVLDSIAVLVQRQLGYRARTCATTAEALDVLVEERPSVLITDIVMEGREAGIELLERAKERWPELPVILMSAVASREAAIRAVNAGAFYLLEKPFRNEHLAHLIRSAAENALARGRARTVAQQGRHARSRRHNHPGAQREAALKGRSRIIGSSQAFLECIALVEQAAATDVTVLLTGESGVGKGILAAHLHEVSARRNQPFLSINCGALAETLLESQLFGHVKGAFTGADRDQPGLVRAADGGTFFLDEVSELSPATQVKLLRVLQEREVIPVGGVEAHAVDVRFVAATNRDLRREVAAGRFREDLFWRLNVMVIDVPPLRDRPEDIPLLAEDALERLRLRDPSIVARTFSPAAMQALCSYSWPGNVRELENAVQRAVVVAGEVIDVDDLPPALIGHIDGKKEDAPAESALPALSATLPPLDVLELAYVEWVLNRCGGDVDAASNVLKIPASAVRAIRARNNSE